MSPVERPASIRLLRWALAIAVVLVLLPLAADEPHSLAGLAGGVAGILLGLVLARVPER